MPDYTYILRRSIEGVQDPTADMRRAIYERARTTIARQLEAVDPPLPSDQIEAQHQKLEQAIAEIEGEYAFEDFDSAEFESEIGLNESAPAESDVEIDEEVDAPPQYAQAEASIDYGTPAAGLAGSPSAGEIRPSRAPMFVLLGLLLLVGIGAAVLGYRYQDQVMTFVDDLTAPAKEMADAQDADIGDLVVGAESEPADDAAAAVDTDTVEESVVAKSEERLGAGAADGTVEELRGSEPGLTIQPQTNATGQSDIVTENEPQQPAALSNGEPDGAEISEPQSNSAEIAAMEQSDPAITGTAGDANVAADTDTVGIGSQKAIFYTQGDDASPGQASAGAVTWSRVEQADGLPAIRADIDLADPKVDVVITISKNTDPALPASHLIEISFDGVSNIIDAEIDRIPALVLKPNEQARGQPLVGAGVPVTESIFWIALSDEGDQVVSNLATLRDGTWFDMPLLFKNKQRALITFEKGNSGEALFKEVLAAWEAS